MNNSTKRKKVKKRSIIKEETLAKLGRKFITSSIKKFHYYPLHKKHRIYEVQKTNEDVVLDETKMGNREFIKKTSGRKQRKALTTGPTENVVTNVQAIVNKPLKGSNKTSEGTFNFGGLVKSFSTSAPVDETKLFVDNEFANLVGDDMNDNIIWKRVRAINPTAEFFVEFTKYPVQILHSRLGTCALSSAIQLIMHNQTLFDNIVPKDQDFDRFWKYGEWQNVVVDDFLPYEYNNEFEPIFSVLDGNSFWYSLLEKAYAKFYGSYKNLAFVKLEDALQDLTGGVVEYFSIEDSKIQDVLIMSYLQKSIIGLVVKELCVFKTLGQPLNCNEIYWLKDIVSEDRNLFIILQKSFKVVTESFPSIEGSDRDLTSLNLYVKNDHTDVEDDKVSMSIDKIGQYFKACKIISFALTNSDKLKLLKTELKEKYWVNITRTGEWDNTNAGGNPQFSRTYWRNPQFRFKLGATEGRSKMQYTIIVELLTCSYPLITSYSIGFSLYEVKCEDDEIWNTDLSESNCNLIGQHELEEKRQITKRFVIPPGLYVFIPYTSLPLIQGSFTIRLFYENLVFLYLWEMNTHEKRIKERGISTEQTYTQSVNYLQSFIKLGITMFAIGIIFFVLIFEL